MNDNGREEEKEATSGGPISATTVHSHHDSERTEGGVEVLQGVVQPAGDHHAEETDRGDEGDGPAGCLDRHQTVKAINEEFRRQIDADGKAWDLRLIYADWLEDCGLPLFAATQRWMAKNKKRPIPQRNGTAVWFDLAIAGATMPDPESDLPTNIFQYLVRQNKTEYLAAKHRMYSNSYEAENALMVVLDRRREIHL